MTRWRGLRERLRWTSDPRTEAEEEIRFHLEERTEELIRDGHSPETARNEAERCFGHVPERRRQLERMIEGRRTTARRLFSFAVGIEAIRSAGRALRRRPLPALAAILSLSLGLAAVATIASLVDELLLRPPGGISESGDLVYVDASPASPGLLAERLHRVAREAEPPVPFARHLPGSLFAVRGSGSPERLLALGVDGAYFPVLGVSATSGRLLDDRDEVGREMVAVVSAKLAARQLGGPEAAVGAVLHVEGRPFTVAGVADARFAGTFHGFPVDVWLPMSSLTDLDPGIDLDDPEADLVELIARLPKGLGPDRLRVLLDAGSVGLRREIPALEELRLTVHPLTGFDPEFWPFVVRFVSLLGIAGLGLLAIAASPVALWLIARGVARRRELAIRAALGAGRLHLAALLLAEGAAVGLLAGVLGASAAVPLPGLFFSSLPPLPITFGLETATRMPRLAVVLGLGVASGLLASLPGVLRSSRAGLASFGDLRQGRGGIASARSARRLVLAQLTVTSALLVLASTFAEALRTGLTADSGVDLDAVRVVQRLDVGALRPDVDERRQFHRDLGQEASELPGIEAAGLVARFPLSLFASPTEEVSAPGIPPEIDPRQRGRDPDGSAAVRRVDVAAVDQGFLEAAGIELLRGRGILPSDGPQTPPVVVVDLDFAEEWFGDGEEGPLDSTVGRRVRIGDRIHTVVGVTEPTTSRSILEGSRPQIWTSLARQPSATVDLVLRTRRPALELGAELVTLLGSLEPDLPVPVAMTGRDVVAARMLPQRLAASFCITFGSTGLVLASFALYALASWRVRAGEREIGIRLGLGATPGRIRRRILGDALRATGVGLLFGLGLGLLGALGASRIVPGVDAVGAGPLLAVAAGLATVTFLATLGPARRASRIDPSLLLRSES